MRIPVLLIFLVTSFYSISQDCYVQVWSDEFDGTSLDRSKWNIETGNGYPDLWGWGNEEVQYYTDRAENMEISNGTLKLIARAEDFGGFDYTSARIRSKGTFDFKYGRIEARIKIPEGQGLWPAFWLLPTENVYGGWPKSGEIDIMENFGQNDHMSSAIHYETFSGNHKYNSQSYGVSLNQYQIFSSVWEKDYISFYMDWNWVGDEVPADVDGTWSFNEDFYLILNLALGGSAGSVNTTFPKTMEVDYIRVFQKVEDIQIQGPDIVFPKQVVSYSLPTNTGAQFSWTAPQNATILNGQGTSKIDVVWSSVAGDISCAVTNWSGDINGAGSNCGNGNHVKFVEVASGDCDIALLNFESIQKLDVDESDGIGGIENFFERNPKKDLINASGFVGRFGRSGSSSYDVMKLNFTEEVNVTDVRNRENVFKMDVYTEATVPVSVTFELVNRTKNTGYPNGIHSQYTADITTSGAWQTLEFSFLNTVDLSIDGADVDGVNILFNPNTNSGDIYYFDNLRTSKPLNGEISGETSLSSPSIEHVETYVAPEWLGSTYAWTTDPQITLLQNDNQSIDVAFAESTSTYTGSIEVTVTNSMDCVYDYDTDITVSQANGFDDFYKAQIQVYPIPTSSQVFIENETNETFEWMLVNQQGAVLLSGTLKDDKVVDLSQFQNGVYQLQLLGGDQSGAFKVIKK